jgi:hydroxymethylpyrimidine/phosphomethylpyrimidine kinase
MSVPVCLSIAGSDSGGGAGIQADLKAFAYFKTFGTTAITAVTAQNPSGVTGILPVPVDQVMAQYHAVNESMAVSAIKTGMLTNAEIIDAVCDQLESVHGMPIIVDPVLVATSGDRLLDEDAAELLIERLLPLATLITPNIGEAEVITEQPLPDDIALSEAVVELAANFKCSVLLKGGHHTDKDFAIDYLALGDVTYRLRSPIVHAKSTHGTGCALSAAIAANLAAGKDMITAVAAAKAYVHHSLEGCDAIGPDAWALIAPDLNDESIVEVDIL